MTTPKPKNVTLNKGGRPSKDTATRVDKILQFLRDGASRKGAANACGISYMTFLMWERDKPAFALRVAEAEAYAENKMAAILIRAADTDWRASESWLKRRRKDDWGDNVTVANLSDDELLLEAQQIVNRARQNDPSGDCAA